MPVKLEPQQQRLRDEASHRKQRGLWLLENVSFFRKLQFH